MKKPDGGPAFPMRGEHLRIGEREQVRPDEPGMSLRDYFAAHAPIALIDCKAREPRTGDEQLAVIKTCAALRYIYADAMIEARNK